MAATELLIVCRNFTLEGKGAKKQGVTATMCLLVCSILLFGSHSSVAQQRGMTAADTLRVANVGEAQIAPDGSMVCYTVSTVEGNAGRTSLWCAPLGDERIVNAAPLQQPPSQRQTRQILSGDWNVSRPRWSPDGRRLAFVAARGGQSGIWVVSPRAERAQPPRFVVAVQSTNFHLPYAGESFVWSPDSRRLAFIHATEDGADDTLAAGDPAERDAARERQNDPRIVERIRYKSRTGFSDTLRTHVWLVDVDNPTALRQLTSGQHYDHALTWNPRGEEIAFLSNHETDADAVNNSDIFAVTTEGRVRRLTETRGCEYEPAWSPDGKLIAYTATTRDVTTIDSVAEDAHVWVLDAAGTNARGRELTAAQDRRARSPRWSPDGADIFFLAGDRGAIFLYRVAASGGQVSNVLLHREAQTPTGVPPAAQLPRLQVGSFSVGRRADGTLQPHAGQEVWTTGTIALTLSEATEPATLWVTTPFKSKTGAAIRLVAAHNTELKRAFAFSEPEEFTFRSGDNLRVQGWIMRPLNFRESERYPLILSIHGGPHGMFGYSFNAAFQAYAARGYAVLFINPRGSTGYGQKFSDGTLREWGGGDYRDLMAGVDESLRRFSWIDRRRMGVTGGSYGGFMTNWIITQTTRFRAAVASASVSNLVSFYSTSLYQDLLHAEFGGFPWDDYDLLWRWSPLRYVRAAETPTLFIHGELDNDVHITQAEEMYMALRRRGVETALARYPREGHGFREPRHRQDALERTLDWFDKYLK
ncbi:MAG TPA: S9 family peptidase [Pyrinomonadaceae bacterium]|jgi:dipeptidyl aminopeptidase/acylaminoacyl peptidase